MLLGIPIAILLLRDALVARGALARGARAAEVIVFGQGEDERVVLAECNVLLARGNDPCARARIVGIRVATLPPDVGPREPDQGGWIGRTLTNEERGEIRAMAHRRGRPHWLLWIWTGMAAFAVARVVAGERWRPAWFASLLALAFLWLLVFSARRTRKQLEEDAARGLVYRALEGEHAGLEVLPSSSRVWTVRGAPAPWRTARK